MKRKPVITIWGVYYTLVGIPRVEPYHSYELAFDRARALEKNELVRDVDMKEIPQGYCFALVKE